MPVVSSNPATARPLGVDVEPGDDVDILINASFECPVDITLSIVALGIDPANIFFVDSDLNAKTLSQLIAGELTSTGCLTTPGDSEDVRTKAYENLVFFRTDVTEVHVPEESLHAVFPAGVYAITLGATPHGMKGATRLRWTTYFLVPTR